MNIDISKIEFEELYVSETGDVLMYFIAPKELVADKYPEAEHATISIELSDPTNSAKTIMMSPTKDGEDYDWTVFELDDGVARRLIVKGIRANYNPVARAYNILLNEMENANHDPDYIIDYGRIEEAIGYLGEALE